MLAAGSSPVGPNPVQPQTNDFPSGQVQNRVSIGPALLSSLVLVEPIGRPSRVLPGTAPSSERDCACGSPRGLW